MECNPLKEKSKNKKRWFAGIAVAILLMFWSKQVAKVAFLPGHMIVPGVILFVFMGAWLGGASIGDWIRVFFKDAPSLSKTIHLKSQFGFKKLWE